MADLSFTARPVLEILALLPEPDAPTAAADLLGDADPIVMTTVHIFSTSVQADLGIGRVGHERTVVLLVLDAVVVHVTGRLRLGLRLVLLTPRMVLVLLAEMLDPLGELLVVTTNAGASQRDEDQHLSHLRLLVS